MNTNQFFCLFRIKSAKCNMCSCLHNGLFSLGFETPWSALFVFWLCCGFGFYFVSFDVLFFLIFTYSWFALIFIYKNIIYMHFFDSVNASPLYLIAVLVLVVVVFCYLTITKILWQHKKNLTIHYVLSDFRYMCFV